MATTAEDDPGTCTVRRISATSTAGSEEESGTAPSPSVSLDSASQPPSPSRLCPQEDDVVRALAAVRDHLDSHREVLVDESSAVVRLGPVSDPTPTASKSAKSKYDTDSEEEAEAEQTPALGHQGGRINLVQLREHLQAAQRTIDHVKGKNVILILGRTGVGKSTLVQRISGRTFQEVPYSCHSKGSHSVELKKVFEVIGEGLPGFEVGHESKSRTKSINHYLAKAPNSDEEVMYLDSSGFDDTTGAEADIATSLSVKRVAARCHGLRFLILVSCTSFFDARGQAVRSLVDLVRDFVRNWKDQRLSFSFLFTHTDHLDQDHSQRLSMDQLRKLLEHHIKELSAHTQQPDTKEMLLWLEKCLRKGFWHLVDVFHPLESDVTQLRRNIEKFEVEVDDQGVEHVLAIGIKPNECCSEVIRCGLTTESVNKIGAEMRHLLNGVEEWLEGCKFGLLLEQMDVLAYLREHMSDIRQISEGAQKIVDKVQGHTKSLLEKSYELINLELKDDLSATAASSVLRDLGSADAFLRLPLLRNEGRDKDKAVKAVLHLLSKLADLLTILQTTPLDAASQMGPGQGGLAKLLEPVPEGTFQKLEKLWTWSEAASNSGFSLPQLSQLTEQGTEMLRRYVGCLLELRHAPTTKLGFSDLCHRRASTLARLIELGHAGRTPPIREFVNMPQVKTQEESLQAELEEQVGKLTEVAVKALEALEPLRSMDCSYSKVWEDNGLEAKFVSINETVGNLLCVGSSIHDEKLTLTQLYETYEQGRVSVEQQSERFIQVLDKTWRGGLGDIPENGPIPEAVATAAFLLQSLARCFSTPNGRLSLCTKRRCKAMMATLREAVLGVLNRWKIKLDTLWEGRREKNFASKIGEQVALLGSLANAVWVDHFNVKSKSVEEPRTLCMGDVVAGVRSKYTEHVREHSLEVIVSFETFLASPATSSTRKGFLRQMAEREQWQIMSTLCPELVGDNEALRKRLLELLATWKEEQLRFAFPPASLAIVLAPKATFAAEVEVVILTSEAVASVGFDITTEQLVRLRKNADRRLAWLEKKVTSLRDSNGNFETKKLLLDSLNVWNPMPRPEQPDKPTSKEQQLQKPRLERICSRLPSFESIVQSVESEIQRESSRIQGELAAGKLEEAEEAIETFKAALCLDEHVRHMVKQTLDTLKQRAEISRTDFDESLKKQLEAGDFDGLKVHLERHANAETRTGKQKAKELWELISSRVELEVSQAESNMKDGNKVALSIGKLERAAVELADFVEKFKTLDIDQLVETLKQHARDEFRAALASFNSAVKTSNLPDIMRLQCWLLRYHRATKAWLSELDCKEAGRSLASASSCLESVNSLVKRFISCLASKPEERSSASDLIKQLNQLKGLVASASGSGELGQTCDEVGMNDSLGDDRRGPKGQGRSDRPSLQIAIRPRDIIKTYTNAVEALSSSVTQLHRECPLSASDPVAVARVRCVYSYLLSERAKGLAGHLTIDFKLDEELKKANQLHEERYQSVERLFGSVEHMEKEWSAILKPWIGIRGKVSSYWWQESYTADQGKLAKQAARTVDAAIQNLRNGEYRRSGIQCKVALQMEKLLADHPETRKKFSPEVKRLHKEVNDQFDRRCRDMWQAVASNNTSEFEQLLLSHYKLVKSFEVFAVYSNSLLEFHDWFTAYLYKMVEELLQAIHETNLRRVMELVELLQRFGPVLSGAYCLYAEVARRIPPLDKSLESLNRLCCDYFGGRALSRYGKLYAILEIPPSANQQDIDRAFRRRSRDCHPDRQRLQGMAEDVTRDDEQKALEEAKSALSDSRVRQEYNWGLSELFAPQIRQIPVEMCRKLRLHLCHADYEKAKTIFVAARDLRLLSSFHGRWLNADEAEGHVKRTLQEHLDELFSSLSSSWSRGDLKQLNRDIERLVKAEAFFSAHTDVYDPSWKNWLRQTVERSINAEVRELNMKLRRLEGISQDRTQTLQLGEGILRLARLMDEVPLFKERAFTSIEQILDECQDRLGPKFVFMLGMLLQQGKVGCRSAMGVVMPEDKRTASVVLDAFPQFRDILTVIWNQQTASQKDLPSTMREIRCSMVDASGCQRPAELDTATLQRGVEKYYTVYERLMEEWKAGQLDMERLISDTKLKAGAVAPANVNAWVPGLRARLPEILAGVGAYFTISKSGLSFQRLSKPGSTSPRWSEDTPELEMVLQRPHLVQIASVLRLLGFDSRKTCLPRQLLEVRTGEGKSMVLGMSSVILALFGFRVRSICYSEYLSRRDHTLFEDLFRAFDVENLVSYSTIHDYALSKVAEQGNISKLTRDMLTGKPGRPCRSSKPQATGHRSLPALFCEEPAGLMGPFSDFHQAQHLAQKVPSPWRVREPDEILLLDEVDMFFGSDFYGQTCNAVAWLKIPEAARILRTIWQNRSLSADQLEELVKTSADYWKVRETLQCFGFVVDTEVKEMCADVANFWQPAYYCDASENRITYKDQHGMSHHHYGYKTAFAYLYEAERKSFENNDLALEHGLELSVRCGQFSFDNINPACILGVSGTLSALSSGEWNIMQRYNIDSFCSIPSVYGTSNFNWWNQQNVDAMTVVDSRDEQFAAIAVQVKNMTAKKRAVIVFFEKAALLNEFQKSTYFHEVMQKNVLSEEKDNAAKDFVIKQAATAGQTTFTTAVFGRGTDFICHDQRVLEAGGMHVIQAFFSANKSEEIQIQGRTARQGQKGTFSMVLCQQELRSQFGVQFDASRSSPSELYRILEAKRVEKQHERHAQVERNLAEAQRRDQMSRRYLKALVEGDEDKSKQFFEEAYREFNKRWIC